MSKFARTKLVYSCLKSGQFVKDFSATESVFLFFLLCRITTEAMGLGGLRADFLSQWRQRKCGRKDCQKHISRPKRIGVCYGFGVLSYSLFSNVLLSAEWRKFASNNDSACLFQLCLNALSAHKMRKVCQNRKVNSTQKVIKSKRP